MASIAPSLSTTLFSLLLFAVPAISAVSPVFSPSPSPQVFSPSPALSHSPQSPPPSDLSPSPAPSPMEDIGASSGFKNSPSPAPSPIEVSGASSYHRNYPVPAPSPIEVNGASSYHRNSPDPAPDVAADIGQDDRTIAGDLKTNDDSGGVDGGKKAGIATGVIAAACIVGVGSVVYKKRQRNVRRSQYSYVSRREIV